MRRVILLVVLLMGLPLRAQTSPTPAEPAARLLEALAFVPDDENSRFYVYYGDFAVAIDARGLQEARKLIGLSLDEVMASDVDLRLLGLTLPSGFQFIQYFSALLNMRAAVGFDLLQIERGVEFGRPPNTGLVLLGMFDGATIAAAHQARGYVEDSASGTWCFESDCTIGNRVNLANRELANIFGGDLGRNQPVGIVGDTAVFSAASETTFGGILSASNDELPFLADAPDFQAIAHTLGELGTVRQLLSSDPALLYAPDFPGMRTPDPQPEGTLPPYIGWALADVVITEGEAGVIALVYDSAEAAAAAAAVLEQRLDTFPAMGGDGVLRAGFISRGALRVETSTYADDLTGLHVVTIAIYAPPPADRATIQQPEGGSFQAPEMSGRFYALLYRGFLLLDLPWLRQ